MKVNGKDYPIYYGKKHVPNHQPVKYLGFRLHAHRNPQWFLSRLSFGILMFS